jgi:hypothetical protein
MRMRGEAVGILDATQERPTSKTKWRVIGGIALAVATFLVVWFPLGLRFHKERGTVERFMNELTAGNVQAAYRTWKPSPSYSFEDFLQDWGPRNGAAPIRSYRIKSEHGVNNAPTAEIVVEVSPNRSFPSKIDENSPTRDITLWVDPKDQSISFPPCGVGPNPLPCA